MTELPTPGAVQTRDVHLRYGRKMVLRGVSFELAADRIYGLLGRNGSGKTSLLSIISAFRRQTTGTVSIFGEHVFENPRAMNQVAFVGSGPGNIPDDFKVNAALREARLLRASWDDPYARQLLELFDIPENKPITALSRGKKSALGMVIGLAARAPLTIFDETHLGMDAPSRQAFYDALLADFMERPRTFVLSTHLIDEVRTILEEVLILDEGKLLLQENTETLLSRGMTLTGPEAAVDGYLSAMAATGRDAVTVIGERRLGRTKAVMLYGEPDDAQRELALAAGLDMEPLELQELFIHLTARNGSNK